MYALSFILHISKYMGISNALKNLKHWEVWHSEYQQECIWHDIKLRKSTQYNIFSCIYYTNI